MTSTNKEKCPCPKHWVWTLSKSISNSARLDFHEDEYEPPICEIWSVCHLEPCDSPRLHAFISKNIGNLQPRQIWFIGSGLFDSNATHLEIVVLYLYQPAAKEVLLFKWQRLGGSLEGKRIRRLICFYTFIWKSQDDTFSVTGNMRSKVLCRLEGWAFLGKWVCPMKCWSSKRTKGVSWAIKDRVGCASCTQWSITWTGGN